MTLNEMIAKLEEIRDKLHAGDLKCKIQAPYCEAGGNYFHLRDVTVYVEDNQIIFDENF